MKTEVLEAVKIYTILFMLMELFGVVLGIAPYAVVAVQGSAMSAYQKDLKLGIGCSVVFLITLVVNRILAHIIRTREAVVGKEEKQEAMKRYEETSYEEKREEMAGDNHMERNRESGASLGSALTPEQKKSSPLIGHFARKINIYPIYATIVYTAFLVFAARILFQITVYKDTSGVDWFSRRGGHHNPVEAGIYMTIIVLVLLVLDLISIFKIKVVTRQLEEDIMRSRDSIQSLDEEFLRSENIGQDIWVGNRHIFFSSGRHSYMFAKKEIGDITQEKARTGFKNLFRPTYVLMIRDKDGKETTIDTFDGKIYERLKKAVAAVA
ncbi:MAG: hypothetical protein II566_01240 [Lachnospiraceae bacterium]|nr:hypothetical protein [Lachnospiraceae bacterium]